MNNIAKKQALVRAGLLFIWAFGSFGVSFFARDLQQVVAGWPVNFWYLAQGGVLLFVAIVMGYAWFMNRQEPVDSSESGRESVQ